MLEVSVVLMSADGAHMVRPEVLKSSQSFSFLSFGAMSALVSCHGSLSGREGEVHLRDYGIEVLRFEQMFLCIFHPKIKLLKTGAVWVGCIDIKH